MHLISPTKPLKMLAPETALPSTKSLLHAVQGFSPVAADSLVLGLGLVLVSGLSLYDFKALSY